MSGGVENSGAGVGVGEKSCVGLGEGLGESSCVGLGEGLGDGEGLGESSCVGLGEGLGDGDGLGCTEPPDSASCAIRGCTLEVSGTGRVSTTPLLTLSGWRSVDATDSESMGTAS